MDSVRHFLQKFSRFAYTQDREKKEICTIIAESLRVSVSPSAVSIRSHRVYIEGSPLLKTRILSKKQHIEQLFLKKLQKRYTLS